MKVVLTGAGGQVGKALQRAFPAAAPGWALVPLTRHELDLEKRPAIEAVIAGHAPDIIVNAAAYTAVDQAEKEPARAHAINAEAVAVLARVAAASGALLVHYSTDYVFSGDQLAPYDEDAATGPLSVYGRSKLAGEEAIRATGAAHLILRTSWVYDHESKNFLTTMVRLARERDHLRVVNDQIGAPTSSDVIATATLACLRQRARHPAPNTLSGIYHLTCAGAVSWHAFAEAIMDAYLDQGRRSRIRIEPIPSAAYPTLAQRPRNSQLATHKIKAVFGVTLPDWHTALARVRAQTQSAT